MAHRLRLQHMLAPRHRMVHRLRLLQYMLGPCNNLARRLACSLQLARPCHHLGRLLAWLMVWRHDRGRGSMRQRHG